jgi:hypothetical protein
MLSLPMGTARTIRRKGQAAGNPAAASPLFGTLATTMAARFEGWSAIRAKAASSSGVFSAQCALKLSTLAPMRVA